jgi:opacity protein-like surface antigen
MRSHCIPVLVLAALFLAGTLPIAAQSNPSAVQGAWPLIVGGGISRFNMDFPAVSSSNMEGPTLWVDWVHIPFAPRRLGLHAEWRKLNLNPPSAAPQLRSNSFNGGPTYTWTFSRLALYGKGAVGYGSMDFPPFGGYSHDSRTIWAAGGGAEYRVWNSVWARADYEYQWWPDLFVSGGVHPNGVTFSLGYDLRTIHRSY